MLFACRYYLPVCQVYPTPPTNPITFDIYGNNMLIDRGVKCSYQHIVQYPIPICAA